MSKQDVVEYIMHTPYNINPAILNQQLDEMIAEEGVGGKSIQSDWNQNDSTAPDYIKNRPFYEQSGDVLIDSDINIVLNPMGAGESIASIKLSKALTVGSKYFVTIDGETVACVCNQSDTSATLLRNLQFSFGVVNVRYYINSGTSDIYTYINYSDKTCHLRITEEGAVKKIDSKYLPDDIQPDWNQNDSTANDYIKNRPFYENKDITVFVEETKIFSHGNLPPATYKYGESYIIECDNVRYTLPLVEQYCNSYGNYFIGFNLSTTESGWSSPVRADSNIPFALYTFSDYPGNEVINFVDHRLLGDIDGNSKTFKIYKEQDVIKKIDPKFLPDMINESDVSQHQKIKFINTKYETEVGDDVVVDYYNPNLHADFDEMIDAYLDNQLVYRNNNDDGVLYAKDIYFGFSCANEGGATCMIENTYQRPRIRYVDNKEEFRNKISNKLKERLSVNQQGICCIYFDSGMCKDFFSKLEVSLDDITKHFLSNSLFVFNITEDFAIFGRPSFPSNGIVPSLRVGNHTLGAITNFNIQSFINNIKSQVLEDTSKPLFIISGGGSPANYFTGESLTPNSVIENFATRGIWNTISDKQVFINNDLLLNDSSISFVNEQFSLPIAKENSQLLLQKYLTPNEPLVLVANRENTTPNAYTESTIAGDMAIEAIQEGKQILIKTPNRDNGTTTAIYSPVLTYQLPNVDNNYLYLFYLRDEKQDLGVNLGLPEGTIMMPVYGELDLKLSNPYGHSPLQ